MIAVLFLIFSLSYQNGASSFAATEDAFPASFLFGAATSAYQIEGAWAEDHKGETIWDRWLHELRDAHAVNADIACDSYHKYKEDVALAKELGLSHYKFSISWARIFPSGFNNVKSVHAQFYYQGLINELLKNNITPIVTMYHWDLPQNIQNYGGWLNENIVDYFTDYARYLFKNFPKVKYWITINEPRQVCSGGYGQGTMAPFVNVSGEADYLCAYHVILAHASVYNLYKKEFSNNNGSISISLDGEWNIPAWAKEEDEEAAERRLQFDFGLYANPLMFGDWPSVVKQRVDDRSGKENFTESRLPKFTEDQKKLINGSLDFLTVDFWDTKLVGDAREADYSTFSYDNDVRVVVSKPKYLPTALDGNTINPDGLRSFLQWVDKTYNKPKILIGGNGIPNYNSNLVDNDRLYYLAGHLNALLKSIYDDKIDVFGYTVWSLLDDFEWTHGYRLHYGLYYVDFNDKNRTRTAKNSVKYYKTLIETRKIPALPKTTTTSSTTTTTTTSTTTTASTTKTASTTTPATSSITPETTTASSNVYFVELPLFLTATFLYLFIN